MQPLQITFHIPLVRYLAVFSNLVFHEYRSIHRCLPQNAESDLIEVKARLENVLRQTLAPLLALTLAPENAGSPGTVATVGEATAPKPTPINTELKLKASVTLRVAARLALQAVAGSFQVQAGLWERNGIQVRLAAQLYSSRKCSYSLLDPDIFMLQVCFFSSFLICTESTDYVMNTGIL